MDPKRELTSVDLAALTTELGRYAGAKVDKVYRYDANLLRLKMRDYDRGRLELMIEVGETKRIHTVAPERVPDAPGRPPDFAKMLRNRLSGADFAGVEQYEFDRILTLSFERPDANTDLVVELFGEGNVAVLDENGEVIDSLETVRLKSRTVAPGSPYEFPTSRLNPLAIDAERFAAEMRDSDTDVVRTLATQLNFGGLWAEELCTRAGVQKTQDIAEADEAIYDRLFQEISDLSQTLRSGDFDPRLYEEPLEQNEEGRNEQGEDGRDQQGDEEKSTQTRVVDVSPVPLEERSGLSSRAFDSFNEALDVYFHRLEQEKQDVSESTGRDRPDFEAEIEKRERIIAQQEGAIEDFEKQADRERERAELLYANYDLVDEILSTIQSAREEGVPWEEIESRLSEGAEQGIPAAEAVQSIDAAEGRVTVEVESVDVDLDASMGVEKNADRLYKEAKRVEEKREGALAAIEDTREELADVQARRERWEAADGHPDEDDEDDEDDEMADVDWLSRSSVPVRQPDAWYDRFRWFRTSDGFLVIGGRNADQNEEIVQKYMDGNDLFFHSEAHGGPATVLKATAPSEPARDVDIPASSREEAAQFAVIYSSVWKDSRHAGDAYEVTPDQVSKTPESGEFLEKGGFAIRGERTYHRDLPARVAVGITCEDETRVIGGPPSAIEPRAETSIRLSPGRYAQNDVAKRCYREFRERFADESFVRKVASPDQIQEFLPPGGSEMVEE